MREKKVYENIEFERGKDPKKSLEIGLPGKNLIAMQGTFSKEFNQALMKEYDAQVVITKDSGDFGGTPSKIEAAIEL